MKHVGASGDGTLQLSSGKCAILEKSYEFILVAWRAVIERQLGREIASVVQGGSGSRQTGIGYECGIVPGQ
jgi:hypothetical protein